MKLPALLIIATLSGCGFTPQGDIVHEFLETRAQRAADKTARDALDYLCQYASVSSINKLFQHIQDRKAYLIICAKLGPLVPMGPIDGGEI